MPGQLKMYSTSTAPANIEPTWSPTMEATGRSAFRRTWRHATRARRAPWHGRSARSRGPPPRGSSTASSASRWPAARPRARARGAPGDAGTRRGPRRAGRILPGAAIGSRSEKTRTSSMPTTKTGIEKPVKARVEAAGSASRPRRRAANIPRGTPIVTASAVAGTTSWSVRGSRLARSRATERSSRSEVPRSPRLTRASQARYWATSGRSSPSRARTRASCSGLAWAASPPRIRSAGSPGRRWIEKKRTVATTHRRTSASPSRRRR